MEEKTSNYLEGLKLIFIKIKTGKKPSALTF